eukprot:SAG11_NODE_3174_length_2633_cov_4.697316_1_plen_34_part_10
MILLSATERAIGARNLATGRAPPARAPTERLAGG